MMKLYFVPRTRATRPRWLLEELGEPYELVRLDPTRGDTKTTEHLTRNPYGHVPVLETADGPIFESAAIALHLADLHPEKKLIPPVGTHERALCYQWTFFAMSEAESAAVKVAAYARAKTLDSPEANDAKAALMKTLQPLEAILGKQPFMLASGFSVADIVLGSVAIWAAGLGAVVGAPNLQGWIDRLKARPAWNTAVNG
jgi:glutathione S-transferase